MDIKTDGKKHIDIHHGSPLLSYENHTLIAMFIFKLVMSAKIKDRDVLGA